MVYRHFSSASEVSDSSSVIADDSGPVDKLLDWEEGRTLFEAFLVREMSVENLYFCMDVRAYRGIECRLVLRDECLTTMHAHRVSSELFVALPEDSNLLQTANELIEKYFLPTSALELSCVCLMNSSVFTSRTIHSLIVCSIQISLEA